MRRRYFIGSDSLRERKSRFVLFFMLLKASMWNLFILILSFLSLESVGLHHSARKPFQGKLSHSLEKIKKSMEGKLAHLRALAGTEKMTTTTPTPAHPPGDGIDIAERTSSPSSDFWQYFKSLVRW